MPAEQHGRMAWRNASHDVSYQEIYMEPQVQSNPATTKTQHEGRSVWVVTAYAISGLALFGVLVYFFSTFITK